MTALAQLMKQLIAAMLRDPRTTACALGASLALAGVEMGWWGERLGWVGAVALVVAGLLLAGDSEGESGERKAESGKPEGKVSSGSVRDMEDMR